MTSMLLYYMDLIINYFKKRKLGGIIQVLYGYPYLKHLIKSCPRDLSKHISKINETFDKSNHFDKLGGKRRLFWNFSKKEFWKRIGCIIS